MLHFQGFPDAFLSVSPMPIGGGWVGVPKENRTYSNPHPREAGDSRVPHPPAVVIRFQSTPA